MKNHFLISEAEKKRILNLHNSYKHNHGTSLISEQVVTDYDSVWDYKKEGDNYFTKKKTSDSWIKLSGNALNTVKSKVFGDSSTQSTQSTQTSSKNVDLPFKNREEGNKFREWVNDNYPSYAKSEDFSRSGPHDNSYIINAFKIYGKEYVKSMENTQKNEPTDNLIVSNVMNPDFLNQIDFTNLSSKDTTSNFCKANDKHCAQFVNDLRDDIDPGNVGNAWTAYRNDTKLGPTVYSAFKGLDENTKQDVIDLWLKIHKRGGGVVDGPDADEVYNIVNKLVPAEGKVTDLKINDIVGIFWPDSHYHEKAFYQGGIKWFKDENGKKVPGNTIQRGDGWGMNTHLGTVGAIKDGVPLIFHNIGTETRSDPPSNLRIAWIKRKGGGQSVINKLQSTFSDWWERITT